MIINLLGHAPLGNITLTYKQILNIKLLLCNVSCRYTKFREISCFFFNKISFRYVSQKSQHFCKIWFAVSSSQNNNIREIRDDP